VRETQPTKGRTENTHARRKQEREREKEGKGETDRQTDRQTDKARESSYALMLGTRSEGQVNIGKTTDMTATTNGVLNGETGAGGSVALNNKGSNGLPPTTTVDTNLAQVGQMAHWQNVINSIFKSPPQQANGVNPAAAGAFAAAFPTMANPNAFAPNLYVNGGVNGTVNGPQTAGVNVLPAMALQMAAANGADPNFLNAAAAQAQLVQAQVQQVNSAAGGPVAPTPNFNLMAGPLGSIAAAAATNGKVDGNGVSVNPAAQLNQQVKRERSVSVNGSIANGGDTNAIANTNANANVNVKAPQDPSMNGAAVSVGVNGTSFAAMNGALRHPHQVKAEEEMAKDGDERELKKQRRKQSNRESARRSRLRKQAECEELSIRVSKLSEENLDLQTELSKMRQKCQTLTCQNKVLQQELHSFASRKQANNNNGNHHNAADADAGVDANQTTDTAEQNQKEHQKEHQVGNDKDGDARGMNGTSAAADREAEEAGEGAVIKTETVIKSEAEAEVSHGKEEEVKVE